MAFSIGSLYYDDDDDLSDPFVTHVVKPTPDFSTLERKASTQTPAHKRKSEPSTLLMQMRHFREQSNDLLTSTCVSWLCKCQYVKAYMCRNIALTSILDFQNFVSLHILLVEVVEIDRVDSGGRGEAAIDELLRKMHSERLLFFGEELTPVQQQFGIK